jgi:hypothetical protein
LARKRKRPPFDGAMNVSLRPGEAVDRVLGAERHGTRLGGNGYAAVFGPGSVPSATAETAAIVNAAIPVQRISRI